MKKITIELKYPTTPRVGMDLYIKDVSDPNELYPRYCAMYITKEDEKNIGNLLQIVAQAVNELLKDTQPSPNSSPPINSGTSDFVFPIDVIRKNEIIAARSHMLAALYTVPATQEMYKSIDNIIAHLETLLGVK